MNDKIKKKFNFIKIPHWIKKHAYVYFIVFFMSISFIFFQKFYYRYQSRKNIDDKIQRLSLEEKEYLTNFFKYTFFISPFGYTIFGDKPMSFETINMVRKPLVEDGVDYMDIFHIFNRSMLKKCWEVWSKYSDLFPLKRFSIISYQFPLNPDYIEFAIINHENFIKIVSENIDDFHTVLENNLTAQQILEEYIKGKGTVFTTIRNHDGLFGTLLGFGRNNAWEFMRQGGAQKMEVLFPYPEDYEEAIKVLKPLCGVIPNIEETANLRKSYEAQQKIVNEIYHEKDFLEQVLLKLSE
jgi:hypothetical protein